MRAPSSTFVLVTLAMNQTVFFEALAMALKDAGKSVSFVCFHERSHEYLSQRGWRSYNPFRTGTDGRELDLASYAWPSLNLVLSHEKAAFEISRSDLLERKLRRYLAAAEAVMDALPPAGVTVVQELGGFLSNVATFYAARRRGIDNIFIEPSFFRGRVAFVRNSFAAPRVAGPRSPAASSEVRDYLERTVAEQRIVIPVKDARHYRAPLRKLTDARNLRRLLEKTLDSYVLGKREEFGHIGGHVSRHVRMFLASRVLARRYRPLPAPGRRFVYYPLHVPADVALTIRAPQYVDQLALIDYLARVVPASHELVIKEHPALIGAVDLRRLLGLLRLRDNVRLLDPRTSNYAVLSRADAVVTVNSKSGAEALLLGRPVIALGDAFYSACDLVHSVDALGDLPQRLGRVLARGPDADQGAVMRYFQDVWDHSAPGELHVSEPQNARRFAESVLRFDAPAMPSQAVR